MSGGGSVQSGGVWGGQPVPVPAMPSSFGRLTPVTDRQPSTAVTSVSLSSVDGVERVAGPRGQAAVLRVLRGSSPVSRVVAVLGFGGAGRSTVAAQVACAAVAHHPGPVAVVDGSGSLWPGLARRVPVDPGRVPNWHRLDALLAAPDAVPVLREFVHGMWDGRGGDPGVRGWVVRVGGVALSRPFEPVAPGVVMAAVDACRSVCRLTIVDCPAEAHVLARVCATAADVLVVVCRADASELVRCVSLLELLVRDTGRDVHGRAVVVPVAHRPGRWPRRAAAAEAAAGDSAVAVARMPHDPVLADADAPATAGGGAAREAAERIAAICAVVAEQQRQ